MAQRVSNMIWGSDDNRSNTTACTPQLHQVAKEQGTKEERRSNKRSK